MPTRESVLNDALALLGQPRMSGPADTSTWVRRLEGGFDGVAQRMLEIHPWNFATVREALAAAAETSLSSSGLSLQGRSYAYTKPAVARIVLVNSSGAWSDNGETGHYEDEGGYIFTDLSPCWLFYISKSWLTRIGSWPAVFAWAVATELASSHAEVSTKDSGKQEQLMMRAREALRAARSWDASQRPFTAHPEGRWVRSRRGIGRNPYWDV
ncbi:MAG: hypothetical protein EBR82_08020 [Caulobacteraceae bacterium]|nr:hypothetical protein [Caulobacteraceae bacterium]